MKYFIKNKSLFHITDNDKPDIHKELPAGTYVLRLTQLGEFVFQETDSFVLPEKMYGNICQRTDRILETFFARTKSTGVILVGEKGSGKTLVAKNVAHVAINQHKLPVIIINQPFGGDDFNKLMSNITQRAIVIFDEFEKVYNSDEAQNALLTLLDGVYVNCKLFIFTSNSMSISPLMKNRPGRIFYTFKYEGLSEGAIEEYCDDQLTDKTWVGTLCNLPAIYPSFNFDMLQALVEEMNRYKESPLEALSHLNFAFSDDYRHYDIVVHQDDKPMPKGHYGPLDIQGNPLTKLPLRVVVVGLDEDNESLDLNIEDLVRSNHTLGRYIFEKNGYKIIFNQFHCEKKPDLNKIL